MAQALIFDVGGVLAHDVWENLLLDKKKGVASKFNLDVKEVRKVAKSLWAEYAHRPLNIKDDWEVLEREYWDSFIRHFQLSEPADYFINLTEKFIRPVPGMLELLERLHSRGVRLAICSNNTEFWFNRQTHKLNLGRFFQPGNIILSSRVGASKSSPDYEMFKTVISALNMDKSDCIFVDDRQETVTHGVEFGITGIIFPSHSEQGALYLEALLRRMNVL
ncbi:MAG TPA: HAD-IA family hydrolase [Pyrinomonadaceae bacterium]|jgi:HAD superfamily hydrolase (TIGR01509 family)|nr:HAD-IA family hydrolase [Pyrinomonadaceae bacterium]